MNKPSSTTTTEKSGRLLAGLSIAICLLTPVATLAVSLPGGYLSLSGEGEQIFLALLLAPYLMLGIFTWQRRRGRRESAALLLFTILLAVFGVWALASEAAGYRGALAESPRGPDYMRDRHQRMELFIVPALQGMACLVIGLALFIDFCRRRLRSSLRGS